jgi:ferric-dicitrate binding protein FerR (iron transport regulator)
VDLNEASEIVAVRRSRYDVAQGRAFFEIREGRHFEVGLPFGLAVVRGTEFNVAVAPSGEAAVTVVEGRVEVFHDAGGVRMVQAGRVATVSPDALVCRRPEGGVDGVGDWRIEGALRILLEPLPETPGDVALLPGEKRTAGPIEVSAESRGDREVRLRFRNRTDRAVSGVVVDLTNVDAGPAAGFAEMVTVEGGTLADGTRAKLGTLEPGATGTITVRMEHRRPKPRELEVHITPQSK